MTEQKRETITTDIWKEIPEKDNPYEASVCYCAGFDVYGDMLGKANWIEYLYLLFKLEPPSKQQSTLLEGVAVAIANPGIRDHSVRAAMNAGVGGSTRASALIAALAVGAGNLGGGREILKTMEAWRTCGQNLADWRRHIESPPEEPVDVWLPMEHPPGFNPNGASCTLPVRQTLDYLMSQSPGTVLVWLGEQREKLEEIAQCPLAMSGVIAAAFIDLDFSPEQGEILYLMLRLPGAAVHALEQEKLGWRRYPFWSDGLKLTNDPGPLVKESENA